MIKFQGESYWEKSYPGISQDKKRIRSYPAKTLPKISQDNRDIPRYPNLSQLIPTGIGRDRLGEVRFSWVIPGLLSGNSCFVKLDPGANHTCFLKNVLF